MVSFLVQIRIYKDEDGARKEEIAQLRHGASDNVFRHAPVAVPDALADILHTVRRPHEIAVSWVLAPRLACSIAFSLASCSALSVPQQFL